MFAGFLESLYSDNIPLKYSNLFQYCTRFETPITVCPLCSGQMLVYRDYCPFIGGAWHVCYSCKFVGDTLLLTSIKNQTSIKNIIRPYVPHVPDQLRAINSYHSLINARKNIQQLWRDSLNTTPYSAFNIELLSHELDLSIPHSQSEWGQKLGLLLGGINYKWKLDESTKKILGATTERITQNWAIITATRDLPGRLTGFIGFDAYQNKLRLWHKRLKFHSLTKLKGPIARLDIGLGFTENINIESEFSGYVFVILEPLLAIQLLDRHFLDNNLSLPIVTSLEYSGYKKVLFGIGQNSFQLLSHKKAIFWSENPLTARQLAAQSGQLYSDIAPPSTVRWPMDWLEKLIKSSKTASVVQVPS